MRRFFTEKISEKNGFCVISGSEARHIIKVLRMEKGGNLVVIDRAGKRYLASLEKATRHEALVRLIEPLPTPSPSPVEITLCQSILKSKHMDYIIQKTSELGVDHIIPFYSERTVVRIQDGKTDHRLNRWREIAQSALKQSDRTKVTGIYHPVSFDDLIESFKHYSALKIILYEGEKGQDLKTMLREGTQESKKIIGIVGPEGGFSEKEVKCAVKAGFVSTSIGNRILRAETAAIIVVALFQYELGDLSVN